MLWVCPHRSRRGSTLASARHCYRLSRKQFESVFMSKTLFVCAVAALLLGAVPTNGNKLLSHLGLRSQCIQGPGKFNSGTYGPFTTNFYFPRVKNCLFLSDLECSRIIDSRSISVTSFLLSAKSLNFINSEFN